MKIVEFIKYLSYFRLSKMQLPQFIFLLLRNVYCNDAVKEKLYAVSLDYIG